MVGSTARVRGVGAAPAVACAGVAVTASGASRAGAAAPSSAVVEAARQVTVETNPTRLFDVPTVVVPPRRPPDRRRGRRRRPQRRVPAALRVPRRRAVVGDHRRGPDASRAPLLRPPQHGFVHRPRLRPRRHVVRRPQRHAGRRPAQRPDDRAGGPDDRSGRDERAEHGSLRPGATSPSPTPTGGSRPTSSSSTATPAWPWTRPTPTSCTADGASGCGALPSRTRRPASPSYRSRPTVARRGRRRSTPSRRWRAARSSTPVTCRSWWLARTTPSMPSPRRSRTRPSPRRSGARSACSCRSPPTRARRGSPRSPTQAPPR